MKIIDQLCFQNGKEQYWLLNDITEKVLKICFD